MDLQGGPLNLVNLRSVPVLLLSTLNVPGDTTKG